ncbi:hypothetical protein CARUB_v10010009mg [Capsella rubella]|uniref:Uncharacterized protein n=1 Tax=Capsella rubella TaxID=81985 RepID=R0GJR3_9BRAS|nr:uncharacterized protein LOC17900865 [Capsella rubella]EOA36167.1 hypothetical protein CARUB_v10010009mg [Capsella rubella]
MAMGALNELYYVLATKPEQEKITPEEQTTILSCHLKGLWTAGFASGVGGGLTWQVTKKLKAPRGLERLALAAGVASVSLLVAWDRASSKTAVTYLDRILSQDGTRMQKELVNVLVKSNRGESWRWQLMSKHFYPEAVYGDEGDKPQMRWRRRTTFTELASSYDDVNVIKSQKNHNGLPKPSHRNISNGSDASKTKPIHQNSLGNPNGQMVEEDALDIIFGGSEPSESIPAPVITKGSGKTQTRKQKRAQRRQRLKNREASTTNTPQYELA